MNDTELKTIGKYAASLTIIEIGLGSLLHSASLPLSGQILSINQIALLSRASFKENSRVIALNISVIGSILKSLSPAGKKLTPMLAILTQGSLFSMGLLIFGVNYFGLCVAITFSASWAFLQPLIFIYILFGNKIIDVLNYFKKDFSIITTIEPASVLKLILAAFIVKIIIALVASIYLINMSEHKYKELQSRLNFRSTKKNKKTYNNQLVNAFFDLFQPLFILTFILTGIFIYYTDGASVRIIWGLLRPVALGLILFYIIRIYPVDNLVHFLNKRGFRNLSLSLKHATDIIKKNRDT